MCNPIQKRGETWRGRFANRKKDGTLYTEEAVIWPVRVDARGKDHETKR